MDGNPDNPAQQLAAAWQAAGDALDEWRQRVSAATTDAAAKLDPALRALRRRPGFRGNAALSLSA